MARRTRAPVRRDPELATRIVNAAIELAEEIGWDNVRLHQVADRLGVSLLDVAGQFRDLDAVANAWFTRARDAALVVDEPDFAATPARERLFLVMMRWFDAVSEHREVARQMLAEKLYLSHPHHWVPMIFDLSRLMHWFLDAARIQGTGRMRQMEETGLTTIFLATLGVWARDNTPALERTRRFLRARLDAADGWMMLFWGGRRRRRGAQPAGREPAGASAAAAGPNGANRASGQERPARG